MDTSSEEEDTRSLHNAHVQALAFFMLVNNQLKQTQVLEHTAVFFLKNDK